MLSGTRGFHLGDEMVKAGRSIDTTAATRRIRGAPRLRMAAFLARPTRESVPEANARTAGVESATRMKEPAAPAGAGRGSGADFTDSPRSLPRSFTGPPRGSAFLLHRHGSPPAHPRRRRRLQQPHSHRRVAAGSVPRGDAGRGRRECAGAGAAREAGPGRDRDAASRHHRDRAVPPAPRGPCPRPPRHPGRDGTLLRDRPRAGVRGRRRRLPRQAVLRARAGVARERGVAALGARRGCGEPRAERAAARRRAAPELRSSSRADASS